MCNNNVPELRERVIHVTSDERSINWEWEKNSEQVNRQLQFVSIDDIPSIRSNTNVVLPSEIQEGDILIKHPFEPDTYLNVVDAIDEIRKDKWFKISEIAQCLGATGFNIKEATESIETRELDTNVGVSYKVINARNNIKKRNELKEKLGIEIDDAFDGCKVISDESYKKAQELAKKYHLDNDAAIRSLIRMRDPGIENAFLGRTIHCEMTKELNSALDIAFSLNVMPNVFSLDANVKKTLETKETITLDVRFEFPEG
jgi:hypothetical protein